MTILALVVATGVACSSEPGDAPPDPQHTTEQHGDTTVVWNLRPVRPDTGRLVPVVSIGVDEGDVNEVLHHLGLFLALRSEHVLVNDGAR